jgi:methyl-accepting chemotaxis protein
MKLSNFQRAGIKLVNLKRASITNRLRIGLGLIILFMVVLTLTGIRALTMMNGDMERIVHGNYSKIACAQSIRNAIADIDNHMYNTALNNDPETTKKGVEAIKEARAVYGTSMADLEKLETGAKGKEIIGIIKDNFNIAQGALDRVLDLIAQGNMSNATNMLTASREISKGLSAASDDMVRYQQERAAENARRAEATFVRTRYFLIILGGSVLVFALFLSRFLANSITVPLSEGVAVARKIAQGDLTARIDNPSGDETGQLLQAMSNMVENLRRIIGEVKTAAGNIASSSQQLNASSELMSKGAGEQAARSSQVATASVEMSQTVLDIAKNASSIETSATGTAKLARDGEGAVERSVDKIRAIAKTLAESADLIKLLGERSNQIGAIINVINEIADQTNLLALNAAIEAARAGDAGRGFAVVADEVRKLAERTGNSTSEIGGMINAIQSEVRRAVLSMDNITKEVNVGVDLSNETGGVLRNIVAAVEQLHLMVQQIASATDEMTTTSDEINRDIEGIASISKETSGNSEQIAQASQELASLSRGLEKVVSGFTV